MSQLIVDEVMLREPNLLVPRKKPVGPVKIDPNHPLSVSILDVFLYLPAYRNFDAIGGMPATEISGSIDGDHFTLNGSSNYVQYDDSVTNNRYDDLPAFSIFADIYIGSLTGDRHIISKTEAISPFYYPGWMLFFDDSGVNANDVIDLFVGGSTNGNYDRSAANVSLGIGRHRITGTYLGSAATGSRCKMYYEGIDVTVGASGGSGAGSTMAANIEPINVGKRENDSSYFSGNIYMIATFNKELSPAEIQSLSSDPYQFLIPA